MAEKKSQSRLPIWIAFGLLLTTIVAAYVYLANNPIKDNFPAMASGDKEAVVAEVKNSALDTSNKNIVEDVSVANPSVDPKPKSVEQRLPQEVEIESEAKEDHQPPILDNAMILKDGTVVIWGSAMPNQKFDVLLDDTVLSKGTADRSGNIATVFEISYSDKAMVLVLRTEINGQQIYSRSAYILPSKIAEPTMTAQADQIEEQIPVFQANKTLGQDATETKKPSK